MATQVFTMHLLLLELLELKSPKIGPRALPSSPPQLNPVWDPLKQNLYIVARKLLLEMENWAAPFAQKISLLVKTSECYLVNTSIILIALIHGS
jgi:hypothetical protein